MALNRRLREPRVKAETAAFRTAAELRAPAARRQALAECRGAAGRVAQPIALMVAAPGAPVQLAPTIQSLAKMQAWM
jgi:hypothetical protein